MPRTARVGVVWIQQLETRGYSVTTCSGRGRMHETLSLGYWHETRREVYSMDTRTVIYAACDGFIQLLRFGRGRTHAKTKREANNKEVERDYIAIIQLLQPVFERDSS